MREKVAVIDLGPDSARDVIHAALIKVGLTPLDDATEQALAGSGATSDAIELAAAIGEAQQKFGALDCKATIDAAKRALPLLAERQAAGLAVPELPRAWAYLVMCADRTADSDLAMRAAKGLRAAGPGDLVPADLLAKYPDVDATLGIDPIDVEVSTEVPDTVVWLDFAPVGKAPVKLTLAPGDHVLAAAAGERRGFLIGRPIKKQPKLTIEMADQSGPLAAVAAKVTAWHGKIPAAEQIADVLHSVHVRAGLIRYGNTVEVWGSAGEREPVRRLGGDDGTRTLDEVDRAAALLEDRVQGWSSHAPDPDQPLLVEALSDRAARNRKEGDHTAWWVYGAIGAAVLGGVIAVYAHHADGDTQEIKLHYP